MKIKPFKLVSLAAGMALLLIVILMFRSSLPKKMPVVEAVQDNDYPVSLVVVTDQDYCPYSFYDTMGAPSGYDVELITLVANKLQMNLDLRMMTWQEGIEAVTSGWADVLMTCDVVDNFKGADKLIKSKPTSLDDFVVYAKAPISVNELNGKRIAIMKGGNVTPVIAVLGLSEYCQEHVDNRSAMQALLADQADVAVMRQDIGEVCLRELGRKGIEAYDSVGKSLMCWGTVSRKPELALKIDQALEELKKSGELERLRRKWLTTFVKPLTFTEIVANNLLFIMLGLFLLVVVLGIYVYKKQQQLLIHTNDQRKLEKALATVTEERNRFTVVRNLINSAHWSFKLNEKDEIISAEFFGDVMQVLNIDLAIAPHAWEEILHPDDKEAAVAAFNAAIADHSGRTPYDVIYRMKDKNGDYNWFRSAGKVIRQKDGGREFFGIHVNINKRIEQERQLQRRLDEALSFTNYLLETYVSAYYVSLNSLSCKVYKRTEDLEKEFPIITNYLDSFNDYVRRDVHPDDRDELLALAQPDNLRRIMARQHELTHVFRDISLGVEKTYRFQVIRGVDDNHVALGFMDITDEIEEQNRHLKEDEESRKLIESITEVYAVAFVINMQTDSFKLLRMDKDIQDYYQHETFTSFAEAKASLLHILHDSDRERMDHELDYDVIRQKLSGTKSYNIEYRVVLNDRTTWHEMKVTCIDKDEVAIGFVQKDLEITKRHLEEKRYDEYFALFVVDIDTGKLRVIKNTEWYKALSEGDSVPYTPAVMAMAEQLDGEPREFFQQRANLDYVKCQMATDDKQTFSYKSTKLPGDKWVDVTSYVILRNDDGTPAMFTLGFSLVDALATAREELQENLRKNHEIIAALTADYSSVYYIDMATEKVTPYVMDEETQLMMADIFRDSERYPDAFKAYVEQFVYEPDREMMLREGRRSNILARLAQDDSFAITYRGMSDGEITFCEMRFVVAHKENGEIKSLGLGFADKDDEIMAQYINEKLVAEYISAFMVDLNRDRYRIFRHPDTTQVMDRPDKIWSLAMADFACECDPEYYELVKNIGRPEFLRAELADVDRREYLYHCPGANKSWRRSVIQVLDRTDGVPSNVVATFMGIDDYQAKINDQQKQLENQQHQLEEALSLAQSANKAKTDFLFNMSHDIRTPMNAIIGFTNMALKHIDDPEKVVDSLSKTREASELLLALINNILDMSRVESGKIRLEENVVDVHQVFSHIEATMQELAEAKKVRLTFAVSHIDDRYVLADYGRCLRVFVNIITNAIKYTHSGGYVKVVCEQTGRNAEGLGLYRFTVEDNGIGMSEEFQQHVFEAFTREESSTVSGIQGTGLGLAVCKTFVTAMNGTIDFKSCRGEGTTFIVTLPFRIQQGEVCLPVPGAPAAESAEPASSFDLKGVRILLVEDNELNREIAEDILAEEGMEVVTANDGSVAVRLLREKGPDYFAVILMDIQMPIMNGYEATGAIRKMYPDANIPIIALSANAFAEDKAASLAAGMDDHIAKPIDVKALLTVMQKLLRG